MDFIHDVKSPRVIFNFNSIEKIKEELELLNSKKVLLVFDNSLSKFAVKIENLISDYISFKIEGVRMHVPDEFSNPIIEKVKSLEIDTVVTIGGGSATGLGKILALESQVRLAVIPTTYAGSEMSSIWGRTRSGEKLTGRDIKVLPRVVFYDPFLFESIPSQIAINSGMNAIAHSVEALYSPKVSPIVKSAAIKSIEIFNLNLRKVATGQNMGEVFENLLYATMLAGFALENASMGIHHKVCHILGGKYDLPHSQMHSAVLPYATAYNEEIADKDLAPLAKIFGSVKVSQGIWDLSREIGAEQALKNIGFKSKDIDEVTKIIMKSSLVNPRPLDEKGIRKLLETANAGDRPE